MGSRRNLTILIAAAFAVLLMGIRPASAGDNACKGLLTANPNELLATQAAVESLYYSSDEWMPPGVDCTWEPSAFEPADCEWKTTIGQDRMLGNNRRLIVATSSRPYNLPTDQIFVFDCDARARINVHYDRFQLGAKVVHATPNSLVVIGVVQPSLGRAAVKPPNKHDRGVTLEDDRRVVDLNDYFQGVEDSYEQPGDDASLRCDGLGTLPVNRLLAALIDEDFQLPGCIRDPRSLESDKDPNYCDRRTKLSKDEMMGAERRLVVVSLEDHDGALERLNLYVFGCISGRVRVVCQKYLDPPEDVERASADAFVLRRPRSRLQVMTHLGVPGYLSDWEELRTFSWNVGLETYAISRVHFRPAPRKPGNSVGSWALLGVGRLILRPSKALGN